MNDTYLLLGSNIGDRLLWLKRAMELLNEKCGEIIKQSSVYETAAWGINDQPTFLNMVILLQTTETPEALLTAILSIETMLGRQRHEKWGPRTIDIDILFYNNEIINTPGLVIPHPFLHERRFTLVPLAEIATDLIHRLLHKSINELLEYCPDQLQVKKYA